MCRREKVRLDADLKSTDLKLITLYQELNLLKNFEEVRFPLTFLLLCLPLLTSV